MDHQSAKDIRLDLDISMAKLSELTGYSKATISQFENGEKVSKRASDKIIDVLIGLKDGGHRTESEYWRDRALAAETRLDMILKSFEALLQNTRDQMRKDKK